MRRILYISVAVVVSTLPLSINAVLPRELHAASSGAMQSPNPPPPKSALRDAPPDTTPYVRSAVAEDHAPGGHANLVTPNLFVRDVVVSNTNINLTNTDMANDGEPSIAVNPSNPNEIVILAFSGSWGATAPLWHSTDGGSTWSKQSTIPVPPGVASAVGCPCDQNPDFGRTSNMSGTFLTADIYSGTTTNPSNAGSWNWLLSGGNAVRTNSAGVGNVDQPWLLVNRDTATASQDNTIVAYDDFSGAPDMRVAVSLGTNPPNFTRDNQSGSSGGGFINPGHRLAVDPRNGWIYSLFQSRTGGDANQHAIDYHLNRSTDGGQTWTLNGSGSGIVVVNANSTQGFAPSTTFDGSGNCTSDNAFKFGTVNALFGGVDHAAVDPSTGDVYYVYGNRDGGTGNNRISIIRLTDNGAGGLTVGAPNFVTGQVQAALPSVAVTSNGIVGVLYTQFDGVSGGGIPMFSAHIAVSDNQGASFTDSVLENFLSSATNNSACKQRVLGDYQQVKAFGTTFYGTFTGNGVPFGRPFANHDPIFFKAFAGCVGIACPANIVVPNAPNQCGAMVTYPAPTSTGDCGTVSCDHTSGSFFPVGTTTVTCTSQAGSGCTFTVTVQDTQPPVIGACPTNITAKTATINDPCVVVTFSTPVASDNCPGVTVGCNPPSGSCFPVGTTTVTCTATDASNNTATCSFTVSVFNVCLQDDSNPSIVFLGNTITGAYRFCCGGTTFSGVALVTRRGNVASFQHNAPDRRVLAMDDEGVFKGTASLQSPPGTIKCTITDRDTRNNSCVCP
jgi:HYR domain